MSDEDKVLTRVLDEATSFLSGLDDRPVAARADVDQVAEALGGPLPEVGSDPLEVVEALIAGAEPGVVAMPSGRFFGWVMGGVLPAALAADWLTSTWDQNAGLLVSSPAAAGAERVATGWLLDLLGLPPTAAVGYVTGGMMANFTCLAAARHEVLPPRRLGRRGRRVSPGAPPRAGDRRRGAPRDRRRRAALPRPRTGAQHRGRRRRAGPDAGGRPEGGAGRGRARARRSSACRRATSTAGRSTRSTRRSRSPIGTGPGCMWTAPSDCGPRPRRITAVAHRGDRAGRLLGHRRPQDTERALRQRPGHRGRQRGDVRGHGRACGLPDPGRAAGPVLQRAGVLPPGPGVHRVGGAPLARAPGVAEMVERFCARASSSRPGSARSTASR